MIHGVAALLLFQLLGESLVFLTGIPIPGPVIGLVLLFAVMLGAGRIGFTGFPRIEAASDGMLSNLGLLFVPAGVGVVALWNMIQGQTLAILFVLIVSAALTLAVTVWAFVWTQRIISRPRVR